MVATSGSALMKTDAVQNATERTFPFGDPRDAEYSGGSSNFSGLTIENKERHDRCCQEDQ